MGHFPRICLYLMVVFTTTGSRASDPEEITFWFYASGSLGLKFQTIVEDFNQKQERWHVTPMMVPWNSNQKYLCAIASGMPPDVMMIDLPAAPGYIVRGALEDISSFVEREGWSDKEFFTSLWNSGRYKKRAYVVPLNSDIRCLIYNRQLFREAGLDPDRPPVTWDELHDYAKRLTLRDTQGHVIQLGFAASASLDPIQLLVAGWQKGGDLASTDLTRMTLNTPPYIEAMRFCQKMIDIQGTGDYLRFLTSGGSALETQDGYFTGNIAMRLITGFYLSLQREFAPTMDARLAAFPMPEKDAVPVSWISGFGLGLLQGCRHPEGAWELIKHLVSEESQFRIATEMGLLPVLRSVAYRPEIYNDPNRKFLIDMTDNCRVYPQVPVIMEAFGNLTKAVEAVAYGKKSPEQALAGANRATQESLDAYLFRERLPLFPWPWVIWSGVLIGAGITVFLGRATVRVCQRGRMSRNALLTGYGFAAPWLAGMIIFTAGPMLVSFLYGFCDYQVLKPARWAGLANYYRMFFEDPLFWKSLWNTTYYTTLTVPLGTILSLGLALLLNQPLHGMRVFRTIFYLPTLITGVAVSMLWMWILQPQNGLLNQTLEYVGIRGPLWLGDEYWSKPSIVLMSLWGVGGGMLIFLAGLQGIPRELYEAAEIDGAGSWQKLLHITLPMLSPALFFIVVTGIIGSLQVFTQVFVVSSGLGGPLDSTLFYVFYLYRKGFEDFEMGYASALAWVLFLMIYTLTVIQLRLSKRWVHY